MTLDKTGKRKMIVVNKKAADTAAEIVAAGAGKKDVERFISESPSGHWWKKLKGYNSLSAVSTGELPAITELMTNSIDANIRLKAVERAIETGRPTSGPEFDNMFRSPRHATAELFGIPNGELAEWCEKREYQQSWLASRIGSVILELGSGGDCKANPTVKIVDRGIGQPPHRCMDTFLNSTEGDKTHRPMESGTYGLGSIVAARVCPYQFVVTKRAPSTLSPSDNEPWTVMIIRTLPSADGEMLECSVLVYGADGAEEFPTLPLDTELYVDETYFVSHHKKHLSGTEKDHIIRENMAKYQQSRGETVEMWCQILEPTATAKRERGIVERARIVARRPLSHGTVRILVDTTFTETWARQAIGGKSGIFRLLERAMPNPILPFLVVENRLSDKVASIETGQRNVLSMFGRTGPLSKAADKIIHIPVDGIKIDGMDMGSVDVTIYYSDSAGGFLEISGELGEFAKLPILVRAGSDVGKGNTHDFVSMTGFSKFTHRFACLVSIDRLRPGPERMSKICSAGRSCDGKGVPKLWEKVITAVKQNGEMRKIRDILIKNLSCDRDELAEQISRALGGQGGGTGETILSGGKKRVPVCVKGMDSPMTDGPDYVWIDREPKFAGDRSLETLEPIKVVGGKPSTLGIATSSRRKINFSKKGCQYRLEAYTDGCGVDAEIVGNNLLITAKRVLKNTKPVTVWVYVTNDFGYKSVPGVVRVLPTKPKTPKSPKPRLKLLPEPTFVEVTPAWGNRKLPVGKAEMVKFSSDADQSFEGFSGEVRHRGLVQPVHIEYIGDGRRRALIPALSDASVGDVCLFSIVAKSDEREITCCSAELVVVQDKAPTGIKAIHRNKRAIIDAAGEDDGGLEILFQDEDNNRGLDIRFEGGIVVDASRRGGLLGVVNRLAPTFVASKKGVKEERSRERTVPGKEKLDELEEEYYTLMFMALRDIVREEGIENIDGPRLDRAAHELTRVARCTKFMRVFEKGGSNYRRYLKYADDPTESQ